ncbi:MAG: class I SAM-dependent methyltransferase [Methanothrix sp.]|nr:class I SAM-dependent methyltransferase [Methanothrix sp.]
MAKIIERLQSLASAFRSRKDGLDQIFKLPIQPFGIGDTERCIEIPWAFSCYSGERRVLDVGYANAENRYLKPLRSLKIPELYGLDIVSRLVPGMSSVAGDMRRASFRDGVFDLIFCISTIEHVGWDNTVYYQDKQPLDPEGDLLAIGELARITRNEGKIVVTVPYGMLHNYGWFLQYDRQRLDRLISSSGCRLLKKDLFYYSKGWHGASEEMLAGVLYKDNDAPAAAGLACVLLER